MVWAREDENDDIVANALIKAGLQLKKEYDAARLLEG